MHVSVLPKEVLDYLKPQAGEKFIDGTVGSGGHAMAIANAGRDIQVLGIDLDQTSLDELRSELVQAGLDQRIILVAGNYQSLDKLAEQEGFGPVDGILLDLGFSSRQVDNPMRGFSFQTDGPLDMRYSLTGRRTAETVVNMYSPKELERIFREYGEEKFAKRLAGAIVSARQTGSIASTKQLAEILIRSLPATVRFKSTDTLRRVFQALRIEVNGELDNLAAVLPKALKILKPGGRLVIISFQSLEDRIVKDFFAREARACVCPPEFPTCICGKTSTLRILTRKPVVAAEDEIQANPRSRSAKLRAAEKVAV